MNMSKGDLITNDWKENPNGEDYQTRIAATGSPDLLRWAGDVLAPRIQSVFNEFSSKYGWGDPGQIPSFGTSAEATTLDPLAEITKSSQRQIQTPEFKRWFGESQVVDTDGKPLVVYHGSRSSLNTFNLTKAGGHR